MAKLSTSRNNYKKVKKGGDVISLKQWKNANEEQRKKWIAEDRPISRGLGKAFNKSQSIIRGAPRITSKFRKLK